MLVMHFIILGDGVGLHYVSCIAEVIHCRPLIKPSESNIIPLLCALHLQYLAAVRIATVNQQRTYRTDADCSVTRPASSVHAICMAAWQQNKSAI